MTGSKKGGLGGKKKRPLSKRLNDPLHDRKPKFPAYVETRADQLEAGTFSRSEVLRMRVSMKGWNNSTLLGLDSLGALDESPG
jgi:hypothetical protein